MAQIRTEPGFASRVGLVRPVQVMEILDRALTLERQGRDIIHLEVAEPDVISDTASLEDLARAGDRIGELLQEGVHR
ncbi:MAG: hypothetical protein O7G84_17360 [Gammaproteobacteria bacterium]|nr:hypothetical protein [Gammaproteobacteria bacterium]